MYFRQWFENLQVQPAVWDDGNGQEVHIRFPSGDVWKYQIPVGGPTLGVQDFVRKYKFKPLTIANFLKKLVKNGHAQATRLK